MRQNSAEASPALLSTSITLEVVTAKLVGQFSNRSAVSAPSSPLFSKRGKNIPIRHSRRGQMPLEVRLSRPRPTPATTSASIQRYENIHHPLPCR
jgi:hypothetical protein